jgi:putative ABC transport system permease protein
MLKSVGMTNSSFNKMLNYECIFYGLKALLYGLPASIGVTYLIYKSIENGVEMGFYLPYKSILVSILSVFIVVFISMMYSMSKIREENIMDGIRNENL